MIVLPYSFFLLATNILDRRHNDLYFSTSFWFLHFLDFLRCAFSFLEDPKVQFKIEEYKMAYILCLGILITVHNKYTRIWGLWKCGAVIAQLHVDISVTARY